MQEPSNDRSKAALTFSIAMLNSNDQDYYILQSYSLDAQ